MSGWQDTSLDYDPTTDGDEEEWARAVAAEGRRTWHPSGVWVTVNGRRVRRWALRRPAHVLGESTTTRTSVQTSMSS